MTKPMILGMLEQGKDGLVRTFDAVPDDKLAWRPLDNGRSALDLIGDAAQTPRLALQLLQTAPGQSVPPLYEVFQQMREERAAWSRADALQHLEQNHGALFAHISSMSDEDLARPLSIPMRGQEMTLPLAGWAMMAYRTYIARFAQINYIQTLYGDFEAH